MIIASSLKYVIDNGGYGIFRPYGNIGSCVSGFENLIYPIVDYRILKNSTELLFILNPWGKEGAMQPFESFDKTFIEKEGIPNPEKEGGFWLQWNKLKYIAGQIDLVFTTDDIEFVINEIIDLREYNIAADRPTEEELEKLKPIPLVVNKPELYVIEVGILDIEPRAGENSLLWMLLDSTGAYKTGLKEPLAFFGLPRTQNILLEPGEYSLYVYSLDMANDTAKICVKAFIV